MSFEKDLEDPNRFVEMMFEWSPTLQFRYLQRGNTHFELQQCWRRRNRDTKQIEESWQAVPIVQED